MEAQIFNAVHQFLVQKVRDDKCHYNFCSIQFVIYIFCHAREVVPRVHLI
jgi:hypothetical protein